MTDEYQIEANEQNNDSLRDIFTAMIFEGMFEDMRDYLESCKGTYTDYKMWDEILQVAEKEQHGKRHHHDLPRKLNN